VGSVRRRVGRVRLAGMAERVQVREIDDDERQRLLRIVGRGTGSVVTWRRVQMILLSALGMPPGKIAEVTFTSADRVRDVIRNFYDDGFASLYAKYSGGRPRTFTLPERRKIEKIAKSRPSEHGLPFSTWSLSNLADFLVAGGWSTTSPTRACGSCSVTRASHFKP
jgi:transposase